MLGAVVTRYYDARHRRRVEVDGVVHLINSIAWETVTHACAGETACWTHFRVETWEGRDVGLTCFACIVEEQRW